MRKYYFVYYSWASGSGHQGVGNIALTFANGEFSPFQAIKLISEVNSNADRVFLVNWKEIGAEAWNEWNEEIEKLNNQEH